MNTEKLKIAASRMVLGLLRSEDLSDVGASALEDSWDSPALRRLAGLGLDKAGEASAMFGRALSELNVALPSKRDAVLCLARETAKTILGGRIGAYEGAMEIWDLTLEAPEEDLHELDTFIYGASEWEDRPEDRRLFSDGIMAAAKDLVDS
jgi:hypothetical protein